MKKIIIVIIMIYCSLFAESAVEKKEKALPHDSKTGLISYQEVVRVDSSITKDALYNAAREWFAVSFKSANDVLQMDDREAGKLIGKGTAVFYIGKFAPVEHRISFIITIKVKDVRYKYEITNFTQTVEGADWGPLEDAKKRMMAQSTYPKTDQIMRELVSSLLKAMQKEKEDDNW